MQTLRLNVGKEIGSIVTSLLSRQIMYDPGVTLFLSEKDGRGGGERLNVTRLDCG